MLTPIMSILSDRGRVCVCAARGGAYVIRL